MGISTTFAGIYNAAEFAYGVNKTTPALQVINGPNTTVGAQALTLAFGYSQTKDGLIFNPLNTNAPITVGGGSSTETVTPSAVSNSTPAQYSTPTLSATFANLHGNGDSVRSGTCGLQEALNYAATKGGGLVIVDPGWLLLGGTQAMLAAAIVPIDVSIWDNRFASNFDAFTYTLTNTQILNMATTAVQLLPTPNALSYWQVNSANLISINTTTAYTGGGAITIGYGTNTATNALSGTIASSFMTSATGTQTTMIEVGSGLTSATAGTAVLGKGIFISNQTTAYASGPGTLQVVLNAALITT